MYLPRLTLGRLAVVGSVLWFIVVALLVTQPAPIVLWLKQSGVPDPVQKFWPLALVPIWGALTFGLYYAGWLTFKPVSGLRNFPSRPELGNTQFWASVERDGATAHDDLSRGVLDKARNQIPNLDV